MSFLSDLDHLKIEAAILPDHVLHTEFRSDSARGLRRARIVKKWYRQCKLGFGSFGIVWLEREGSDAAQLRAVKVIQKDFLQKVDIDYTRELKALAEFSKPKVRP